MCVCVYISTKKTLCNKRSPRFVFSQSQLPLLCASTCKIQIFQAVSDKQSMYVNLALLQIVMLIFTLTLTLMLFLLIQPQSPLPDLAACTDYVTSNYNPSSVVSPTARIGKSQHGVPVASVAIPRVCRGGLGPGLSY